MGNSRSANQRLFVLSGPSGCGKATLLNYVTDHTDVKRVVTYTTRDPRPNEQDGVDYHFVTVDKFNYMYDNGELIEREQVYGDRYYGSPRNVFAGTNGDVIMELDTKGTENYRRFYHDIITIFILPPSIDELVRRIQERHPEANLNDRLAVIPPQLESASDYDYLVINDIIERAGEEILDVIRETKTDAMRDEKLKLVEELAKQAKASGKGS